MIYQVIGTMSGSSMDGLDIAYCTFEEVAGKWSYRINEAVCLPFDDEWIKRLKNLQLLSAKELMLTHTAFGHWMGHALQSFIEKNKLDHQVHLISSHGHTVFHEPQSGMTFQMGDGASIAAITQLPVVSDLRNMDIALGGQGAPIVPIGEKLLWNDYPCFLNIGGICNITAHRDDDHLAFDICAANRVLNVLANELDKPFDMRGEFAAQGKLNESLLRALNNLDYYQKAFPKSLSNEFGLEVVCGILNEHTLNIQDKLHTYCVHIAVQIKNALLAMHHQGNAGMLITGGGAFNDFLIDQIKQHLIPLHIEVMVPEDELVEYKEALVMGLIGVLRWREEINVLASVTGAKRNSVGGALWMGQI